MKITSENIFYVSGNAKEAVISRYFYFYLKIMYHLMMTIVTILCCINIFPFLIVNATD